MPRMLKRFPAVFAHLLCSIRGPTVCPARPSRHRAERRGACCGEASSFRRLSVPLSSGRLSESCAMPKGCLWRYALAGLAFRTGACTRPPASPFTDPCSLLTRIYTPSLPHAFPSSISPRPALPGSAPAIPPVAHIFSPPLCANCTRERFRYKRLDRAGRTFCPCPSVKLASRWAHAEEVGGCKVLKGFVKAKSCAAWFYFVLSSLHSRSSHARFHAIHQIEIVKTAVSEKNPLGLVRGRRATEARPHRAAPACSAW